MSPKKKILITAGLVIAAVAAGGMAWMASTLAPGIQLAQEAPEITLISADGTTQSLNALRGGPVLLDFWTST